ncbi:Hypothetical protein CAP_8678 [Chondromyces apiculatus DSM 436]|uniref:Uncharacterized protein n=1 Tax=Chondromyces apiculatus DSM 436 TaxID=1192034 RepID=A0A017TFI2_9BACT|nr:Hypothetical protein CAP_8678 [Chondromyces apiculatus DSM 436]
MRAKFGPAVVSQVARRVAVCVVCVVCRRAEPLCHRFCRSRMLLDGPLPRCSDVVPYTGWTASGTARSATEVQSKGARLQGVRSGEEACRAHREGLTSFHDGHAMGPFSGGRHHVARTTS